MARRTVLIIGAIMLLLIALQVSIGLAEFGTNWRAEYYDNRNLEGSPVEVREGIDGINFDFDDDSPIDELDDDNFSIRFSSTQTFAAGTYEFVLTSDDGARVFIDGALVLDRFVGRPVTTDRFTQTIAAGSRNLVVEYFEAEDQAEIRFEWFLISSEPGVTATPTFTGPTPTPLPTFTATAIPPTGIPPIPDGAIFGTIIREPVVIARSAPSINASERTRVLRGQQYVIIGKSADLRWFLMQMSGFQAWVFCDYVYVYPVSPSEVPVVSNFVLQGDPAAVTGVVLQSLVRLNIREHPTQVANRVGQLGIGDVAPVLARSQAGDWLLVEFGGVRGWVAAEYARVVEGDIHALPVQ